MRDFKRLPTVHLVASSLKRQSRKRGLRYRSMRYITIGAHVYCPGWHKCKCTPPISNYYRKYLLRNVPSLLLTRIIRKLTLQRAFIRLGGDKPFLVARIFMPIFISLVVGKNQYLLPIKRTSLISYPGSTFYNTGDNTKGFFSREGVLFFSASVFQLISKHASDSETSFFSIQINAW